MSRLGSVQQKVPCLFVTQVKEEPSAKRERQPFKVLATETITEKALDAGIYNAIPTEKVDGTCCYVTLYKGQPYLWARLDRKPNKPAEKRFKRFLYSVDNSKGWVPVEKNSKQYCWHTSVVDYEFDLGLVLKHHPKESGLLEIRPVPLSDLSEQTLELIGTNVNANPYGLGSKKHPVHLLVPHGAFQIKTPPALNHNDLLSWFNGCNEGKIEGIVWHCSNGHLIKLHRHHLGLTWPIVDPHLTSQPVVVAFSGPNHDYNFESKTLFNYFSKLDGQRFSSLRDIAWDL
ncbi:RNA ligase 1 isoform X2 [Paroedura picta]|uniref:RNA ligase 1 isoform X2 n=1 Tax=Paroedura picta TaxID=143630 RepID=UPI0040562436